MRTEENCEIVMVEERRDYLSNVISTLVDGKLVRKGCEEYLAFISDTTFSKLTVNDIWTVMDFLNVFLKKLSAVPPNLEVTFGIDLLPDTASVSIAPYHMTPKELELKAQL